MLIRVRSSIATWRIEITAETELCDLKVIVCQKHSIAVEQQFYSLDIENARPVQGDNTKLINIGLKHGEILYLQGRIEKNKISNSSISAPPSKDKTSECPTNSQVFIPDDIDSYQETVGAAENRRDRADNGAYFGSDDVHIPPDTAERFNEEIRSPDQAKHMTLLGYDDATSDAEFAQHYLERMRQPRYMGGNDSKMAAGFDGDDVLGDIMQQLVWLTVYVYTGRYRQSKW